LLNKLAPHIKAEVQGEIGMLLACQDDSRTLLTLTPERNTTLLRLKGANAIWLLTETLKARLAVVEPYFDLDCLLAIQIENDHLIVPETA